MVESGVDHGGLRPIRAHQVHRLGVVLLPPARVLAHELSCNEGETRVFGKFVPS